jgi:hypothetical protein
MQNRTVENELDRTLEKDRAKLINLHIARRRALYTAAIEAEDLATAARIIKDEGELLGLYPPKTMRTELSGKDGGPIEVTPWKQVLRDVTDDELALLQKLAERMHGVATGTESGEPN